LVELLTNRSSTNDILVFAGKFNKVFGREVAVYEQESYEGPPLMLNLFDGKVSAMYHDVSWR